MLLRSRSSPLINIEPGCFHLACAFAFVLNRMLLRSRSSPLINIEPGCFHLHGHGEELAELLLVFVERQVDAVEASVRSRENGGRLRDGVHGKLSDVAIVSLERSEP